MRVLPALAAPLCLVAGMHVYRVEPGPGDHFALEVEKTGLMSGKKHRFLFGRYRGRLSFDAESPERSSVELIVEAPSITCKDTWVKPEDIVKIEKAAREDMLAAKRYPQIVFRSEAVIRKSEDEFEVRGGLTIRDRTAPVTVLARRLPPQGTRLRFQGSATVRLRDYGLKPPSALLGAIGTKNEMRVEFVVSAEPEDNNAAGRRSSIVGFVVSRAGGQGRNRTADASLFRAALYQLSYLAGALLILSEPLRDGSAGGG